MTEDFIENKIKNSENLIGDRLRNRRIEKNLELEEVAKETKININYLKAIEEGDFEKLPKGVYGKNFISEYAIFLGINPQKIIDLYKSEFQEENKSQQDKLFVKKASRAHYFIAIPKIIKNILVVLAVFVCIAYLGYYINNIISPPEIEFHNLKSDRTIKEHSVVIKGKTDPEAELLINDNMVLLDDKGNFSKKINLKEGLNVVSVSVKKKYSRENIIKRNIIVK